MPDSPLSTLLAALLPADGWEPLPGGECWRRDAKLDPGGSVPLPVALALVPLGGDPLAPLVFTATVPAPVRPPRRAGALLAAFSSERVAVGTVEVSGGRVRYRLAHDPAVAPHSVETIRGLVKAGTARAEESLSDALFALAAAGMTVGRGARARSERFTYTSPDQIRFHRDND